MLGQTFLNGCMGLVPNTKLIFQVVTFAEITEENQFCEPEKITKDVVFHASLEDVSDEVGEYRGIKDDELILEGRLVTPKQFTSDVKLQRNCMVEFESHSNFIVKGKGLFLPYTRSRFNHQRTFGDWVKIKVDIEV